MGSIPRDVDAFTMLAGASVTDGQFGKQSAGKIIPCSVLGERADCIIGSTQATVGGAVDCLPRSGRLAYVTVGAVAVAQDAELTPDANGLAKTAISTNIVRAKALVAGGAGATIPVLWVDAYAKP